MRSVLNDFSLRGRTALITGSSAGIGYALARGLAGAGATVVLNGRDERKLEQAAATLRDEVKMLTKGMAIDLGPHGIQVNGLGPGYIKTELTEALVRNEEFSAWLIGRTPSRRWGDVEDLMGAAVFLASDASNFVNGHILYVDGGVTATL